MTREKIGTMKEEEKASVSSIITTNSILSKNLFISLDKDNPAETRLRSSRQSTLRSSDVSLIIFLVFIILFLKYLKKFNNYISVFFLLKDQFYFILV